MTENPFRRVRDLTEATGDATFEAGNLPEGEKEMLCRALLEEFGATSITVRGAELIHRCVLPLGGHTDNDSLAASLNYDKLTYNCFVCGNSGGLLWFIATCRDTTGTEARRWLADEHGLGGTQGLTALLEYFDSLATTKTRRGPETMPKLSPKVLQPWARIHPYLTEVRGIHEDTLVHFQVGWDEQRNRITIPHFWRGNLVGWQTRRLSKNDPVRAKYKSSPDFPKDRTIYNFDPDRPRAIVVESPMSVLSKWHLTPEIEATFGAEVTDRQVRQLAHHHEVVLFFDNDPAGFEATRSVGERLAPYGPVYVAANPFAADAADLTPEYYQLALDDAVPFALWQEPKSLIDWKAFMKKYGTGEVIKEEGDDHKTAAANWTEDDAKALAEENARADGRDDDSDE